MIDFFHILVGLSAIYFTIFNAYNFLIYAKWYWSFSWRDKLLSLGPIGFALLLAYGNLGSWAKLLFFPPPNLYNFVSESKVTSKLMLHGVVSIGTFLVLQIILAFIKRSYIRLEQGIEDAKSSRLANEKKKKSRKKFAEDKKAEFQETICKIGLIEKVTISKNAVENFPIKEFDDIVNHLTNDNQKSQVLSELNEKIRSEYENLLLSEIGGSYKDPFFQKQLDQVVNGLMKMGLEMMLQKYGLDELVDGNISTSGREISKTRKWEEIKRKL